MEHLRRQVVLKARRGVGRQGEVTRECHGKERGSQQELAVEQGLG